MKRTSSSSPGAMGLPKIGTRLPPQMPLSVGFCDRRYKLFKAQTCEPLLRNLTVAGNAWAGASFAGTSCDSNAELKLDEARVTVMAKSFCDVAPAASATCTVKTYVPSVVGVPPMSPDGLNAKPGGSGPEPAVSDQR